MMPMMLVMLIIVVVGGVYAFQGVQMQNQVGPIEDEFHTLQDQYWSLSKAERDAAPTGSDLNKQLVELQQTPSTLLMLKLIGIGKILTGIFVILFGILIALVSMPMRLAQILKKGSSGT